MPGMSDTDRGLDLLSPPRPPTRRSFLTGVLVGCGISLVLLVGAGMAAAIALTALMASGHVPDTSAIPGESLPAVTRDFLVDEGIVGNVSGWDEGRIHAAAWPIAQKSVEDKLDIALELWERSYGRGKTESELAAIAKLAVAGRIRLLLTEKGRTVWGRFDRSSGDIEIIGEGGTDPGGDAVDLLDELAEVTIQHGGRALVLPGAKIPTETGIAAVLR